jgi:acyl carrier protein
MIAALEEFLFDKFNQMPLAVRVFTYLFMLFLFAYLLLIPRFINGELVYKFEDGSTIPYIGGDIKMSIEGRLLKFKANEGGYWSVPIVSPLPRSVSVKFHHIDADRWFAVDFKPRNFWFKDMFQVEVTDEPPRVQLSASVDNKGTLSRIYVALGQIFSNQVSTAKAGMLELPGEIGSDEVDTGEVEHIRNEIIKTVSKVTGKDAHKVTPSSRLADDIKATYVQRIKIVKDLERKFNLRIPYEHWNYLYTVSELVDYVHKRKIIEKKKEYRDSKKNSLDWPSIQQKTPIDQRPIFKR